MENNKITEDFLNFKNTVLKAAITENPPAMLTIDYSKDNFNTLFPWSRIATPIENVKFGSHQFAKFSLRERRNLIAAVYETLRNPDIVIAEKRENDFGELEDSHNYAKNFMMDEKSKMIQSVIVEIENENVIITSHERPVNEILSKIEKAEQLIYISPELGSRIEQNLHSEKSVVNSTQERTLQSKTLTINKDYIKDDNLSITNLLKSGRLTNHDVLRYGEPVGKETILKVNKVLQKDSKPLLNDEAHAGDTLQELMQSIGDSYGYPEEATKKRSKIAIQTMNRANLVWERMSEYKERLYKQNQKLAKSLNTDLSEEEHEASSPDFKFEFTDKENIEMDEREGTVTMTVSNTDNNFTLESRLDPHFDKENEALTFYYQKNIRTGAEYVHWVNHTANPNREGYVGTSKIPEDLKDEILNSMRPIFEREYDSLSYDKIVSGGLEEDIFRNKKEDFLKDTMCSENAYNKFVGEIKNRDIDDLHGDFNLAIGYGNNELAKELLPVLKSHKDGNARLAESLFTALENWNTNAFRMILDEENTPGEIISKNNIILRDAAADMNLEIIDLITSRYQNNKEILSSLVFETDGTGKTALDTAIYRWHEIEAEYSDRQIPDAIIMLAQVEDSVTADVNISVFKDPKSGNFMTVNSLINGYETNIFDRDKKLIAHDTFEGYKDWQGDQKDAQSKLEAALVTMQDEQGKNWSNWKQFERLEGPEKFTIAKQLENIIKETFNAMEKAGVETIEAYNQYADDRKLLASLTGEDKSIVDGFYTNYNIDNYLDIEDKSSVDKTLSYLSYAKLKERISEKCNKETLEFIKGDMGYTHFVESIVPDTMTELEPYYKISGLFKNVDELVLEEFIGKAVYDAKISSLEHDIKEAFQRGTVENVDKESDETVFVKISIPDDIEFFMTLAGDELKFKDGKQMDDFYLLLTANKEGELRDFTLELIDDEGNCRDISLVKYNFLSPKAPKLSIDFDFMRIMVSECSSMLKSHVATMNLANIKELFVSPKPGASFEYGYDSTVSLLTDVLNNNHEFPSEPVLSNEQVKAIMYYLKREGKQIYIEEKKGNLCIYDTKNFTGKGRLTDNAELIRIAQESYESSIKQGYGFYSSDDKKLLDIPFYKDEYKKLKKEQNGYLARKTSASSVAERYVESVKKILHDEDMADRGYTVSSQPVEKVLVAAQKALSAFSNEEKAEISKFLLSKGAKDSMSMGNILKKSISDKKSPKKERDERNLPER